MFFLKKWKIPFLKNESQEGPPDIEEIFRKLKAQIYKNFKNKQSFHSEKQNKQPIRVGSAGFFVVGGLVLAIWFLSGIFIVSPAEQTAILYFGKYAKTVGPGPHWIPRLIASRYTVNVQQIATFPYQAEMLTKDENIVSVDIAVQYRIDDVKNFLFNVVNPSESLQQATASALRQIVGQTTLDEILTTGRAMVRDQVNAQIKKILTLYQPGLLVTDVTLQPAKPPEQVTEAFDDAIKAREDEQRYINQAQAYSKRVTAAAQGQVSRILQEADAQKQKTILLAEGETAAFAALLPQYQKAPQVMSKRMYFEAMSSVLSSSSKILMDAKSNHPMFYMPLDKLIPSSVELESKLKQRMSTSSASSQTIKSENDSSARFARRGNYNLEDSVENKRGYNADSE